MVRKTTDKSQKVKQNVKQSVNVKVQIGDYKKKSKKGKGKPRRKAAARGGVGEHNPYAQSYNPVYIQSGNAPDLAKETKEAKEPQSNNPLLSAIEDLTNNIKRTHVENVSHPLTKAPVPTPKEVEVVPRPLFKKPPESVVAEDVSLASSLASSNDDDEFPINVPLSTYKERNALYQSLQPSESSKQELLTPDMPIGDNTGNFIDMSAGYDSPSNFHPGILRYSPNSRYDFVVRGVNSASKPRLPPSTPSTKYDPSKDPKKIQNPVSKRWVDKKGPVGKQVIKDLMKKRLEESQNL